MKSKPKLAIDIFNKYVSEDWAIDWPKEESEKSLLARAILGKTLISSFDSHLETQFALIDDIETPFDPSKTTPLGKQFAHKREKFKAFTKEQDNFLKSLILDAKFQSFFDVLTRFDQPIGGTYEIKLNLFDADTQLNDIVLSNINFKDLHDELSDWVLSFSKFSELLVELVEHDHGWAIHTKDIFLSNS